LLGSSGSLFNIKTSCTVEWLAAKTLIGTAVNAAAEPIPIKASRLFIVSVILETPFYIN
jgi:hypothetical protein